MLTRGTFIGGRHARGTGRQLKGGGGAPPALTHLLQATFSGSDSGAITDAGDVETASSGSVETGALTVQETSDGQVEVLSNQLKITGATASGYTQAVRSGATAFVAGTPFKVKATPTFPTDTLYTISIHDDTGIHNPDTTGNVILRIRPSAAGGFYVQGWDTVGNALDASFLLSTFGVSTANQYEYCIVTGGYTSAGVPDVTGTYGWSVFRKDVTGAGSWTLVVTYPGSVDISAATRYAHISHWYQGISTQFDDMVVADTDVSAAAFTPTGYVFDSFTVGSDTALASHTGETSETWIEYEGSWEAKAATDVAQCTFAPATARALVDFGSGDAFVEVDITRNSSFDGILMRHSPSADTFVVTRLTNTLHELYTSEGGSETQRSTASKTHTNGVTYHCTGRVQGNTMEAWCDGGAKVSYSSGVWNSLTRFGFRTTSTSSRFDNFHMRPLTSADYDDADTGLESF